MVEFGRVTILKLELSLPRPLKITRATEVFETGTTHGVDGEPGVVSRLGGYSRREVGLARGSWIRYRTGTHNFRRSPNELIT